MKILYEDTMPYADTFLAGLGDIVQFSHKTLSADDVANADILLVRSTTKVNAALLAKAKHLKLVATATAGTDHVDKALLASRRIPFYGAAGCNAVAVAEYVISAILAVASEYPGMWSGSWQDCTVGIVGAGQVGTALAAKLDALGMSYRLCDPPLEHAGDPRTFVSLDEIMACDIITLHTPLVMDGLHPTYHMFDESRLAQLTSQQLLINACRGEVMDNAAALALQQQHAGAKMVLDVWEQEPDFNRELAQCVAIATPHIAGHTIEGKARGTEMVYQRVCQLLDIEACKTLTDVLPTPENPSLSCAAVDLRQAVESLVWSVYDVRNDDNLMKSRILTAQDFVYARKHYAIRREFAAFSVNAGNSALAKAIYRLGFATP